MAGTVRVGVAGVGSLGFRHARILREIPGVELVGIHDIDPERLAEVSATLGAAAFGEMYPLLDAVDALVVAVPTTAHEDVTSAALERGVSVLVAQPIAAPREAAE